MNIDKIVCVGKNYLAHALELGDAVPEKPVLFLKPASVMRQAKAGETIQAKFPSLDDNVHPECEIVLQWDGAKISAVTLGLDLTLRNLQAQLKKQGHPWTTAKVFPDAAIIGPWVLVQDFPDYLNAPFSLTIDGEVRQKACGNEMMMKPEALITYISQFFPLCPGDIIFTGTPVGVSSIKQNSVAELNWQQLQYFVQWGRPS